MGGRGALLPLLALLWCVALLWRAEVAAKRDKEQEELLIGWRGNAWNASAKDDEDRRLALATDDSQPTAQGAGAQQPQSISTPWIETIAWKPRAFVHHNFLTEEEVNHLVTLGNQRVARSMVIDAKTGASRTDDIRTSYGASFARGEDSTIAGIEQKIAEWTHIPPENGEPIQMLRYMDGQKYGAHWDWFDDPVHHADYLRDGNRFATVLMYLSEVEEGGETALPLAHAINESAQQIPNPSECAAKLGIAVRPRKGDALLFFDMDVGGSVGDRAALHASCPTLKGTKFTATKWIHNKKYMGSYDALGKAMKCTDTLSAPKCGALARAGACDSQPNMTGMGGLCRRTCKDCVDCPPGDIICGRSNMRGLRRRRALDVKT